MADNPSGSAPGNGQQPSRPGYTLIFRPWITKPDGTVIYAKNFGKRAFPIWVPAEE